MAISLVWNLGPAATCGSGALATWNRGQWTLGCQRIARGDDGKLVCSYTCRMVRGGGGRAQRGHECRGIEPGHSRPALREHEEMRTLVGRELGDANFTSEISRGKWSRLYAALREDLGATAKAAGPTGRAGMDARGTEPFLQM
ncbi:hypothetical protein LJR069_004438 [Variovorax paradoxus]